MFFSTGHFFLWIIRYTNVLESSLKNLGLVNKVFTQQHSCICVLITVVLFDSILFYPLQCLWWWGFPEAYGSPSLILNALFRCILQKLSGKLTTYFNASTSAGYYFYLAFSSASLNEDTSAKLDYFKQSLVVTSSLL